MNKIVLILWMLSLTVPMLAQSEKRLVRQGNKLYQQGEFEKAAAIFQQATDKNPVNEKAGFNLGNALYQQKDYENATQKFKRIAEMSNDKQRESRALYNAGNSLMGLESFSESIPLFKQALRLNPNDEDARYNLAYARRMLQQQQDQQNNQQGNDDQKQKDDQNKDQQGDNKDDKQQQQQDNQQQTKDKEQQQQQQQQQQPQLSKEEAERMLQALTGEEKKTLEKLNEKRMAPARGVLREKDW